MYYPVAVGGPLTKIVDGMVAEFEKQNPDVKVNAIYAGNYNDARIKAAIPTISYALSEGANVGIISHLGRPIEGKFDSKQSLKIVAERLSEILNKKVFFSEDVIGKDAVRKSSELKRGEVLLLENVRFHNEETAGDIDFSRDLSKLGDCYINDAFGTTHREHASTATVAKFFEIKCAGLLLQRDCLLYTSPSPRD